MENLVDDEVAWQEVVPDVINVWLTMFAIANFVPKKLLKSTMLGMVSVLL